MKHAAATAAHRPDNMPALHLFQRPCPSVANRRWPGKGMNRLKETQTRQEGRSKDKPHAWDAHTIACKYSGTGAPGPYDLGQLINLN